MRRAEGRAVVTLRGVRFSDHPKNSASLRGELVEWERMGRGRTLEAFDEKGTLLGTPQRRVGWGDVERRAAHRASRRRWRRMIEDGDFDVTERFERARRDARRRLAASLLPVGVAVAMGGVMIRGMWTETFPGSEWITWAVGVLIGVMVMVYGVGMLGPTLAVVRSGVVRARATGEWLEIEDRRGDVRRWRWSQLREVRRRGLGACAALRFDDGDEVSLHLGRLRPVMEWRAAALSGGASRVGWGGPLFFVVITQMAGAAMAWGVMRAPGLMGPRTAWETYAVISSLGLLFAGIVWWGRWLDAKRARRSWPRRVARGV